MKKLLLAAVTTVAIISAGTANAADLVMKAPVKPSWSWAGLYVGANIGYSWGNSDTDLAYYNNTTGVLLASGSRSFDMNGPIGGLQIGYNWYLSPKWILGLEADIQLSGQDGDSGFVCTAAAGCNNLTFGAGLNQPINSSFEQSLKWFGTLRGRLGYTVTPSVLAYVTGGLAFGQIDTDGVIAGFNGAGDPASAPFGFSDTNFGWTVGGGLEAHLGGNWTGKLEYLYIDFGSVSGTAFHLTNVIPLRFTFDSDVTDHILRIGLNYKFPPTASAVVAKY